MVVGVFYKHREWVDKWFDDLINRCGDNAKVRIGKNEMSVECGVFCVVGFLADKSFHGRKIDKAICEPCIYENSEIIDYIIRPLVLNPIEADRRLL